MQIVIDISEDDLDAMKYLKVKGWANKHDLLILNGTVLPESHGDLIDRNELLKLAHMDGAYDYVSAKEIADAHAIVKAEEAEETDDYYRGAQPEY